ncbi:MAG: HIT family protein [Candidatus Latescibacterota bacterium]
MTHASDRERTAAPCRTCELIRRRDAGVAPLWDSIHRTACWDLVHAFNASLPGWLVLVCRRHVEAVADLTEAEAAELGPLIRRTSLALAEATGCPKTYVMQFAEHADHPHVHFHVVPRMADLPEERRSTRIFAYLGVPEDERVGDDRMDELAARVRRHLLG